MLGRGKAATRLNSWSRCLGREDGTPSPASPSSSTAAACTRSWSRTAARWRNIRRRTGETTVRIFIATRPANRNWVRNPSLVHLHPLILPVLVAISHIHISVQAFTSWTQCAPDAKLLMSLGRKGKEVPQFIIKSKLWFPKYFRIRT